MAVLSEGCKPDNFESHNSLKLSFTNIWGNISNFVECEPFLESNSPDILALCETNWDDSIDSGNNSVRGYFPLVREYCYSYPVSCSLWEGKASFCLGRISRKPCGFLFIFSTGFNSFSSFNVLLIFPLSITFFIFMHSFWCYVKWPFSDGWLSYSYYFEFVFFIWH